MIDISNVVNISVSTPPATLAEYAVNNLAIFTKDTPVVGGGAAYHVYTNATDVLTGAVVGGAVGFAVPYLLHRPLGGTTPVLAAAPLPGGAAITASCVW